MDNKLEIDGLKVVDEVFYNKYLELQQHPLLQAENRYHICSDGTKIDIKVLSHYIHNQIQHLPETEQEEVKKRKSEYHSVEHKLKFSKRKALGQSWGKKSKQVQLFDERDRDIIELFGKMFTPTQVLKIVHNEWKLSCTLQELKEFRDQNKEEISAKIEEHKRTHSSIRLATKRSRLEELTFLYEQGKDTYQRTKNQSDGKFCKELLGEIRREVEGDKAATDSQSEISTEQAAEEHVSKELLKGVALKEIILGRISAKMGISGMELIEKLNGSYYQKYSKILHGSLAPKEISDPYPSELSFDFENIVQQKKQQEKEEALAREKEAEQKTLEESLTIVNTDQLLEEALNNTIVEDTKPDAAQESKDRILELLKKKQGKVNKARNDVLFEELKRDED